MEKKKKTIEKRHRRKQYREDADVNLGQAELWPSFYTVAHQFVFYNCTQWCTREEFVTTSPTVSRNVPSRPLNSLDSEALSRKKKKIVRNSLFQFLKKGKGENSNNLNLEVPFPSQNHCTSYQPDDIEKHRVGFLCHQFLHVTGLSAWERREVPFSEAHSCPCKGKEEVSYPQRHLGHLLPTLNLMNPLCLSSYFWDSLSQTTCSYPMKSSASKETAQSLFQIWGILKSFQDIVLTGCHGGFVPMGKANDWLMVQYQLPYSTFLHFSFPIGHRLVFLEKKTE